MAIWFDMTNSLDLREGGVVGVLKAELEMAKQLKALHPGLRISRFDGNRFLEVNPSELAWLWDAASVGDAWLEWKRPRLVSMSRRKAVRLLLNPDSTGVFRLGYLAARTLRGRLVRPASGAEAVPSSVPFGSDDVVLSYGWMGSGKEREFERIRSTISLTLVYMIYDLAMLRPEIQAFYGRGIARLFEDYVAWASRNCAHLLFGGRTAQEDTERWQLEHGLPSPESDWVAHGSEVTASLTGVTVDQGDVLAKYGVRSPFVMAVGSLDPKKNYEILYRAYRIALAEGMDVPQLVIAGGIHGDRGLANTMNADPALTGRLVIASPSDMELDMLYDAAEFTLLPSMYEGWSLTLPEALAKGKFTLASDVAPLREIGGELVEYLAPDDPRAWATRIRDIHSDPDALQRRSERVRRDWSGVTWSESAKRVLNRLGDWESAAHDSRRQDFLAAHGIGSSFALVLGPIDDAANPETALRAMLKVWERDHGAVEQLVYCGAAGTLSFGYLACRTEDPRLENGAVVVLNNVEMIPQLLESARIVLVTDPHGAEQIAVALASGRTLIASDSVENRQELDGVELVDPFDVYAWADRVAVHLARRPSKGSR